MYPLIRFLKVAFQARKQKPLAYEEGSSIQFRCRPWDLDMFNEMNNGRVLTLYDLGRFELAFRNGLMATLKRNKWALVVAGSSVRYRKRIKLFDQVTMHSKYVGHDDKWMYLVQSMWVNDEACSSVLIRAGVTSKKGLVTPQQVIEANGSENVDAEIPTWVQEWIASEQHRPWPPIN